MQKMAELELACVESFDVFLHPTNLVTAVIHDVETGLWVDVDAEGEQFPAHIKGKAELSYKIKLAQQRSR